MTTVRRGSGLLVALHPVSFPSSAWKRMVAKLCFADQCGLENMCSYLHGLMLCRGLLPLPKMEGKNRNRHADFFPPYVKILMNSRPFWRDLCFVKCALAFIY